MRVFLIVLCLAYAHLLLHFVASLIGARVHGIRWGAIVVGSPTLFKFSRGGTVWKLGPVPLFCSFYPASTELTQNQSAWLDPKAQEIADRGQLSPFARDPRLRRLLWYSPIATVAFVAFVLYATETQGSLGELASQIRTLFTAVWLPWSTGADAVSRGAVQLSTLPLSLAVRNAVLWLLVPWAAWATLQNLMLPRPVLAVTVAVLGSLFVFAWFAAALFAILL